MKAIRIQNLRSLADTGYIPIRPMNLLVGRNGSGKSTFLRTFPLLKQSTETPTTGPILWYGRYVDFGTFKDALRIDSAKDEIIFSFKVDLKKEKRFLTYPFRNLNILEDLEVEVQLTLNQSENADQTIARSLKIIFGGHEIYLVIQGSNVDSMKINGREVIEGKIKYYVAERAQLIPSIVAIAEERRDDKKYFKPSSINISNKLISLVNNYFHGRTIPSTKSKVISRMGIGSNEKMLHSFKNAGSDSSTWLDRTRWLNISSPQFSEIRDFVLAYWTQHIVDSLNTQLSSFIDGISYVNPLRAAAERYYRRQDLSVSEIDPKGSNLAMYLRSLNDFSTKAL